MDSLHDKDSNWEKRSEIDRWIDREREREKLKDTYIYIYMVRYTDIE